MKKFLLIAAMLLVSTLYASADYKRYYVTETVKGDDGMYCIRIDWDENLYELEGDGNEGDIRNLKENGNQRTFDVYFDAGYGTKKKVLTVVFTTETKDTFTIETTTPANKKSIYKVTTKDPEGGYGASIDSKIGEKAGQIKEAIGKGITKGIDAMKNKQEENKAKKEAKKQEKE